MITTVFFDFYGTLVKWSPAAEEIQREAALAEGLVVDTRAIGQAYPTANALLDQENARSPIAMWSQEKRDSFFTEYERTLLATAGYDVEPDLAQQIWERVRSTPKQLALFEDVEPALRELKGAGLKLGVISNMNQDMGMQLAQVGLADYLSTWVSSAEVGVTKPHAAIFQEGLARAGVTADQAAHVGDGYDSDVGGARNAGMLGVLVWRDRDAAPPSDCPAVTSLTEVLAYLRETQQIP
jgi:HAD superfamily hydrolase (TIGR01549 family)